jgi:excinuclease ABC subunit A
MKWVGITAKPRDEGYYKGIIPIMSEILKRDRNKNILKFVSSKTCSHCSGSGLKKESLQVTFNEKNFPFYTGRTFSDLKDIFTAINSADEVEKEIIPAILKKCEILIDLGLGYLTPERRSNTLSGGESQRLRISAVLDSKMSGIMYIFDEPSIGLHGTDNFKLISVFRELVSRGNSVIVVEHDKETILAADHIIDIGPGAGYLGGKLLYSGKVSDFNAEDSVTYNELREKIKFKESGYDKAEYFSIKDADLNNLKNIDVDFKLNSLNVVTGVSGAGKSSLVNGVAAFRCAESFKNVVEIDARQPGKNSRSNAATYTGIFDDIRNLYSKLPDSLPATAFSFNTGTGRCEECLGKGETEITMHFLDNIKLTCISCNGKRFHDDVLKIKFHGKSIYDVLELEISEACEFFRDEKKIFSKLDILNRLGLGYLKLGQPTSTLSGGEAKRLKLSAYLDSNAKNNLILLDEPTTGLSMFDTKILLKNLVDICKVGNSVIAIEHDAYFISQSDHIVDLGPGAGDNGGEVLYQGSVKGILECKRSLTAKIFDLKNEISDTESIISDKIILENVSTNNLKNISLEIEKNKITLVKGGECAGKNSLITDTLFNEANNLYLSSLSAYARQFIGTSSKGEFGSIRNLSPAISLSQEKKRADRISFAQVSGIYELYRLLYSRFSTTDKDLPEHQKNNSLFSFLHINGACQNCSGRGITDEVDINRVANFDLSIEAGAMNGSKPGKFFSELTGQYMATLYSMFEQNNIVPGKKLHDYSEKELDIIFYGTGDIEYDVNWAYERANRKGVHKFKTTWKGFANLIKEDYLINLNNLKKKNFETLMVEKECPVCGGKRLNDTALSYKINKLSISDLTEKSVKDSIAFFENLNLENSKSLTSKILIKLNRLSKFSLGYLSLNRSYNTLSSGEKQRLRLAMLAEEKLKDILYILDEPANGLYYKEEHLITDALKELKDLGNTVIISDPKERFVSTADNVVELEDGNLKFNGASKSYCNVDRIRKQVFPHGNRTFSVKGAFLHNLKDIDVDFSYNTLNVVHGPCGSGKSTLVFKVLAESLKKNLIGCRLVEGKFDNIIIADDHYSSKTVGSYFEMNNIIMDKLAKANKVKKSAFTASSSYCLACQGKGYIKGNLDFLRETDKVCSVCEGRKYKPEILRYKLSGKNISEMLDLSTEGLSDIINSSQLIKLNKYFDDLGIKNISLNRKFTSLSVWQRKRMLIIKELLKNPKNNLIVIDEPSAGLDLRDIEVLLNSFEKMITDNTIVITEHDRDVISCAGKSIELGHGSGEDGGYILQNK